MRWFQPKPKYTYDQFEEAFDRAIANFTEDAPAKQSREFGQALLLSIAYMGTQPNNCMADFIVDTIELAFDAVDHTRRTGEDLAKPTEDRPLS